MIDKQKIIKMTEIAKLEKEGKNGSENASLFRRRDYIALHTFAVWISCTIAYLILSAGLLILIFGSNPDQYIDLGTIGQVAVLWGMVYLVFCVFFCWIAFLCYDIRYRKAMIWQSKMQKALKELRVYYRKHSDSRSSS